MGRGDPEMQFSVRKTSRDRCWSGLSATIYETSGGFANLCFAESGISMHVGPPLLVRARCDGRRLRYRQVPGDIKIFPAGFSGLWEADGPSLKLSIPVSPALLRTAAEEMGVTPDRVSIEPQLHLRDPQIEFIGWALKAELETEDPFGRLYADSLGLALAAHLLRRYAPLAPKRIGRNLSRRQLQRVTDYIHDHLTHDLTLAEVAKVANVSPSHFKVLFKQSVGIPVHQYVVRSRVEHAMGLLSRDKFSLEDVAHRSGFADQSHMARCMRRVFGITPTAVLRNAM